MMKFLAGLFQQPEDGLGNELRAALGTIVKRAMRDGDGVWSLDLRACSICDVPVGDWRLTVQRIDYDKERGTRTQKVR